MKAITPGARGEVILSTESANILITFISKLTMGQMCELTITPQQTKDVHDAYAELCKQKKEAYKL